MPMWKGSSKKPTEREIKARRENFPHRIFVSRLPIHTRRFPYGASGGGKGKIPSVGKFLKFSSRLMFLTQSRAS